MVKLFSNDHTFHHPFEHVSSAFWRKYPNERAPHVKAIDIIDRHLDAQANLIIKRVIKCESQLPQWLLAVGVPSSAYAVETTIVNAHTKQMLVRSRNISGSSMLVLEESCLYRPQSTSPFFTAYSQQALITSFLPMFKSKFESFTLSNLHSKSKDGLATMEALCQRIQQNGVKSLIEPLIDAAEAKLAQIHLPNLQNILPTSTAHAKQALLVAGINVGMNAEKGLQRNFSDSAKDHDSSAISTTTCNYTNTSPTTSS